MFFIACMMTECIYAKAGKEVSVVIESYDRTILWENVEADTFLEAVQRAGNQAGISIIIGQDNKEQKIESVDGIKKNALKQGGDWYGYLTRDRKVMQQGNILDTKLEDGDSIVLYYGEMQKTKIVGRLEAELEADQLVLTAANTYQKWSMDQGTPKSQEVTEGIGGVRIHLEMPNGLEQIGTTDQNGKAVFSLSKTGYYTYYGEKYQTDQLPGIVKTEKEKILYGIENPEEITRGEFACLLAQAKNLEKRETEVNLLDIENHPYQEEIQLVVANQWMNGYPDGTFCPQQKISFLECILVLSRDYEETEQEETPMEGVPDWAAKKVQAAVTYGLIAEENQDFHKAVSIADLNNMLQEKVVRKYVTK